MKKSSFVLLISVLLASSFSSFLFADNAIVASVKGKVEVNRNNNWIQLKVGDKIAENETVNTGFNSEAKIKYNDSILYLAPLTRVTLETLVSTSTSDKVNVYLNTGAVRSKVNHTENKRISYTVRNPVAVASVRGTDFTVSDSSDIECFDGAVAVCPVYMIDMSQLYSTDVSLNISVNADSANSNTPSANISSVVPENSLVIGKNQSATFNNKGDVTNTPANDIFTNMNNIAIKVSSASARDALSSSTAKLANPSMVGSVNNNVSVANEAASDTATISVTVNIVE